MASGLIDIMKRASLDAANSVQMCDLRYGKVVSTSPLKVQVTNQFTIPQSLLVVPEHLTNHTVKVKVDWSTGGGGSHDHGGETPTEGTHSHSISGTKTMTVYGALKIGDKVALLRKQGGQSYFILDRI